MIIHKNRNSFGLGFNSIHSKESNVFRLEFILGKYVYVFNKKKKIDTEVNEILRSILNDSSQNLNNKLLNIKELLDTKRGN